MYKINNGRPIHVVEKKDPFATCVPTIPAMGLDPLFCVRYELDHKDVNPKSKEEQ